MTETGPIAFNWNIPSEIDHFQFADRIQWWRCNRRKCLSTAAGEVEFIVLSGISLSCQKSLWIHEFLINFTLSWTLSRDGFSTLQRSLSYFLHLCGNVKDEALTDWLHIIDQVTHLHIFPISGHYLSIYSMHFLRQDVACGVKNEEELESIGNAENS